MRKRILFILGVLDSGGVAKSMVSLINAVDRQKYDISLLLMSDNKGPYYDLLPQDISIIQNDIINHIGGLSGVFWLTKHGHLFTAVGCIIRLLIAVFSKPYSALILSKLFPSIEGEWDLIVDYNGQQQTYYMVDKLKAKKKASFFHSDYAKWSYYYKMDKQYYPCLDAIFTISPTCVESLKRFFPDQTNKIHLMENISSSEVIYNMAEETVDLPGNLNEDTIKLLTIGHITKNKGTDMAIEAAKILKSRNIDFQWYFIGNTAELPKFKPLIDECGVRENMHFLGLKTNPYPYFKAADMVVHPSLFEGKSVTLDEAKLLCKPIVVTNFSTVHDQFENGLNATICKMSSASIANAIQHLIKNNEIRNKYIEYLEANKIDNTSEVKKLYKIIDDNE